MGCLGLCEPSKDGTERTQSESHLVVAETFAAVGAKAFEVVVHKMGKADGGAEVICSVGWPLTERVEQALVDYPGGYFTPRVAGHLVKEVIRSHRRQD